MLSPFAGRSDGRIVGLPAEVKRESSKVKIDRFPSVSSARKQKIELRNIGKTFSQGNNRVAAIEDVSLAVGQGEFISIVGPSGCGKSTVFNVIAGLITPDVGEVLMDGQSVAGRPGSVGYMLQKDLLLPWRTVLQNVTLGAELLHHNKAETQAEARQLMATFGLRGFEDSWPSRLSGGMRQRAALMRTVLSHQEVMLLDEPFGALDAMTKSLMQEWLLEIWAKFQRTIVFITHDIDEAIFLSDRIYIMTSRPGRIKTEVVVDLKRPRASHEITTTAEFGAIKHRVMAALRDEIAKAYGAALSGEAGTGAIPR
jgi:ABC-type nitrate/sulfonate/bicarbonate transport system ATPase subunit